MSTQFRIMDYNYAFDPNVGVTASSADGSYPVSNMAHFFRSKVWRSAGNFKISSTNNKIDFSESVGGAQLTATIDSDEYSPDELATEIKAKMEAVGADIYTVSFNAGTGKWTITSDGVALELRFGTGTHVATSLGTDLGFAASDYTGAVTYTAAQIAIHNEEWVLIDLLTEDAIDSFALIFDQMVGIKFTEEATLTLQANNTDSWDDPDVSQSLTIDENFSTVTHFFSSDQNYRYWRLKIIDPSNPNLYVELGKIYLTKATQLGQGPEIGLKYSINDLSKNTKNEYGHVYADIYPNQVTLDATFKALTQADMQTLANIYNRVGNTTPICIAHDPTETLFDKDRFFVYGRLKGDFKVTHAFYDYFDTSLSIEEAF
jgi:hypothetical protein